MTFTFTFVCGNQGKKKKITNELIYNRNKLTGIENKLMVTGRGREEG